MNIFHAAKGSSVTRRRHPQDAARARTLKSIILFFSAVSLLNVAACKRATQEAPQPDQKTDGAVYQTYGVHNAPNISPCAASDCIYQRGPGEPADPIYPEYWVSNWSMYRVFNKYSEFPPPYADAPPAGLKEGADYEKSTGTTYYDSTWTGRGGAGAMMEHYENRCLPIFPISNKFTCSLISLGDVAFFVTYDKDRPAGMPPVCLFSKFNHPPKRDFIAHLPYSKSDSARIGAGGQGYSFWISAKDGKPVQTGVSPDRTDQQDIMFGYGFALRDGKIMPQSFYFSGYPLPPANAPFVSQNYFDFKIVKPDPSETWDQVDKLNPASLPQCQLFNPPANAKLAAEVKRAPTWSDIGRWNSTGVK